MKCSRTAVRGFGHVNWRKCHRAMPSEIANWLGCQDAEPQECQDARMLLCRAAWRIESNRHGRVVVA